MVRATPGDSKREKENPRAGKGTRFGYRGIVGVIIAVLGILALVSLFAESRGPGSCRGAGMRWPTVRLTA